MPQLVPKLNTRSEEFKANATAMRALVDDLNAKLANIAEGGGEAARAKHLARGKLLPRERVRALIDPGSPFLEFSQLAAHGMYGDNIAAAGIITGLGRIAGSTEPGGRCNGPCRHSSCNRSRQTGYRIRA